MSLKLTKIKVKELHKGKTAGVGKQLAVPIPSQQDDEREREATCLT